MEYIAEQGLDAGVRVDASLAHLHAQEEQAHTDKSPAQTADDLAREVRAGRGLAGIKV
jgi:hypothetical protein